ncbi:MAG: hypothetical protein K2J13_04265 [Clostridia bacterium]|nr:hypothetical protein [Clostridia bacterium]
MVELGKLDFYNRLDNYCDRDTEEVYKHYSKSAKGYFLDTFFGLMFWKCVLMSLMSILVYFLGHSSLAEDSLVFKILYYTFIVLPGTIYIIDVSIKIWFWKYSRNVIVTNQGIWIMWFSTFWWSKNFKGKKRLFSASWSLYAWEELSGVFEEECKISKICKLKDFVMDRWDGEETVRFLKSQDVAEILELSVKHINPRKRKTERDPKPPRFGRRKTNYYE